MNDDRYDLTANAESIFFHVHENNSCDQYSFFLPFQNFCFLKSFSVKNDTKNTFFLSIDKKNIYAPKNTASIPSRQGEHSAEVHTWSQW